MQDRTFVCREVTGEEIEERGLAGTVRADDTRDLMLAQAEVDVVDSRQRTEAFRYASGAEDFGLVNNRAT